MDCSYFDHPDSVAFLQHKIGLEAENVYLPMVAGT